MKNEYINPDGLVISTDKKSEKWKHDFLFGERAEEVAVKIDCDLCGENRFCISTQHVGRYCIPCHETVIEQSETAIKEAIEKGKCELCGKNKPCIGTATVGVYCKACHRLVIRESKHAIKIIQKS